MKRAGIQSGGGAKGIIPLYTLQKIEQEFGPLYQYYDLLGGSSVGAINMALLATGKVSVKQLISIYPDMLKVVFKPRGWLQIPKYDRNNFVKIWNDLIGQNFKMSDCKCKLQITSVNVMTQRNHFFKSWEDKDGEENLIDVVLRSFAAPVYFGTLIDDKNKNVWFDGGMGNENLPIDNIFIECRDKLKWANDMLQIDAFGCGYVTENISFDTAKKYKAIREIFRFIDIDDGGLARAQSAFEQVSKMEFIANNNNNIGFKYWDIEIPKDIDALDGIKFIEEYKKYGIEMSKKPLIDIPYQK